MTAGKSGPRKKPCSAMKIADTWKEGTSQNMSWHMIAMMMYTCRTISLCRLQSGLDRTKTASFSPSFGVMELKTRRPVAMPVQNPVATIPDSNSPPALSRRMKVTIQPPSAPPAPTYPKRKIAAIQVTRLLSACFRRPSLSAFARNGCSRYTWPELDRNAQSDVASSMHAPPSWLELARMY